MFFETIDPTRAKRTEAILEVLAAHFHGPFRVVELGTGPGPLTVRILRHFPKSAVIAVDTDPVLLQIGAEALYRFRRRITWVLTDIREEHWSSKLPLRRVDAVVSSLALHWLEADEIGHLYRNLGRLLRPGGLLVNGDYLPSRRSPERIGGGTKKVEGHRTKERQKTSVQSFKVSWAKWWREVEREPSMQPSLRERQVRLPGPIPPRRMTGPKIPVSLERQERMLRDAGFTETRVVWQEHNFRVLVGAR
ncbi:MAG: class I SAM-dependent methyltransferase [Thermoplasmata archaeon]